MKNITKGMIIAAAAASLFAGVANAADVDIGQNTAGTVHCFGINSCKGMSECNTATTYCKGMNKCKGRGWIYVKTEAECKNKGGKVVQ